MRRSRHANTSHTLRPWLILAAVLLPEFASASSIATQTRFELAYIDPGTGSFLVQALVAAIAGIAVTPRMYWQKISAFLGLEVESDDISEPSRDDD